MPKEIGGEKGKRYYNSGAGEDPPARDAGLIFGKFGSVSVYEEYVSRDTPSGKPEVFSANNLLSASFGLVYGCAKSTYRGTAPKPSYPHGGPAATRRPLTRSVWFSCRIDGAQGDDQFSGYAVGWTRGKTAWLVVAQDESATRAVVAALGDAAQ
jgi:hypothetical protein